MNISLPSRDSVRFSVSRVGARDFEGRQGVIISTHLGLGSDTVLTEYTHLLHGFNLL